MWKISKKIYKGAPNIAYINLRDNINKLKEDEIKFCVDCIIECDDDNLKINAMCIKGLTKNYINALAQSIYSIYNITSFLFYYSGEFDEKVECTLVSKMLEHELHEDTFYCFFPIDLLEKLNHDSIDLIANKVSNSKNCSLINRCLYDEVFKEYKNSFISSLLDIDPFSNILVYIIHHFSKDMDDALIIDILDKLSEKNAYKELCKLISNNILSSKYFPYIMTLLYNSDNVCMNDIKSIPADKLDSSSRNKLTILYCKLGIGEDILNYFEKYYGCLDETDNRLIVKRVCELNDKETLIALSRYETIRPYYNDIFESLSQIENISYEDIVEINFNILNKNNKDKYVDIVCKSSYTPYLCGFVYFNKSYLEENHIDKIVNVLCERLDEKNIYKFSVVMNDKLSSSNISDLVKVLSKTNSGKYIYKFAKNIKNISRDDISVLAEAISNTNDIEYIYLFLKNISNIKNDYRKLLKSKILESCNIKFVCLAAVYIDVKLIKKLFGGKKQMYRYMVSSNLFNQKELLEASLRLFDGYIDPALMELQVRREINKINNKKYEMTIKQELNKKDNRKDNK